jgi:hypothetical protein
LTKIGVTMAAMTRLQAALLLITLASLCSQTISMVVNHHQSSSKRRALFFFGAASTFLPPPPAQAIQERNELLCGTGFFTNIGQWYCTELGNIADEGKSGELSKQQDQTADSLMSKLGLSDSSESESSDKKSNAEKETKNKQ